MAGFGGGQDLRIKTSQGWGGKAPGAYGGAAPAAPQATPRTASTPGAVQGVTGRMPMGSRTNKITDPTQFSGAAAPGVRSESTASPYGSESGPGILESWFNQRASGDNPAFNYAAKRGMESLGNSSSAAGAYNSGAARQQESDFMANLTAQNMGQLDALAGGASGEHQGRLNAMFGQGQALAGGQAGTMGAYDLASAHSNDALMQAIIQMMGGKAGVDDKSRQAGVNNFLGFLSTLYGGGKK